MSNRVRGLLERILARRREIAAEGVADLELLRRFVQNRDEAAFELLVWRHGAMVLGLCQRTIRDAQLAEDAFQAVFLILARKASAVRGNVGGWLFKVARRVAGRALQKKTVVQPAIERAEVVPDSAERGELFALLDAEIARLPERLRRPIVLCYLGGYSTEDAAREIGCPRGTVLSRLSTARERLAERLTHRGVVLPASLVAVAVSGELVSTAAAAASSYRSGSFTQTVATQLADGVLQTMKRVTFFAALGGLVLATTLATGIGWVTGQQGPNKGAGEQNPTPATAVASADGPEKPQPKPKPAAPPAKPEAPPTTAETKVKKLREWATELQAGISKTEDNIRAFTETVNGKDEQLKRRQKQFDEADEECRRVKRELDKLEVEVAVLKKLSEDKDAAVPPDPILVQQAVNNDPAIPEAKLRLKQALDEFNKVAQAGQQDTERFKTAREAVTQAQEKYEDAPKKATERAVKMLQESEKTATRQRIAKLNTEILIKKEILTKLEAERATAAKQLVDANTINTELTTLRAELELLREFHTRVRRELILAQLGEDGITFSDANKADAKLDQILRELTELRKDVQGLKLPQK